MITGNWLRWACAAGVLALAVAACGGSSSSTTPPKHTAAPTTGEPTSGAAAQRQVAANWTAFFNPKTPVSRRVALLQDGQTFAEVIRAQAETGLGSSASASVSQVTVTSASQATVDYSLLLGGKPALANQSGTAVYQGGTWKVGLVSFCGLLAVEAGGNTASLPGPCKNAA